MTDNTKRLKDIYNYCKTEKNEGRCNTKCVLARNCIETDKRSRYNDPRFVKKCYDKVEKALAKERKEMGIDPFAEVRK